MKKWKLNRDLALDWKQRKTLSLMIEPMKQKDNLEIHAVLNFIEEYNRNHRRQFCFLRACSPPLPDTICQLNEKEIGIEVVHTYGTGEEAAMRLGNLKSEDIDECVHWKRRLIPLDVRALGSLNRVLSNKAAKTYSFSFTWLIIRNGFVLWSLADYRRNSHAIHIPKKHPFKQIWFLCDRNSLEPRGIMRLV